MLKKIRIINFVLIIIGILSISSVQSTYFHLEDDLQVNSIALFKKWSFKTEGSIDSSPLAIDFDGNGELEILIGSDDNCLYYIDANGELIWKREFSEQVNTSPCVADLDMDGEFEIIVGTNEYIPYCLSFDNTIKWQKTFGHIFFGTPAITDIDQDGKMEIIAGCYDQSTYCLEDTGVEKWKLYIGSIVYGSPAIGDINADNIPEILLPSENDTVFCIDNNGGVVWKTTIPESFFVSPLLIDLDGDNRSEALIIDNRKNLYCCNGLTGAELWRFEVSDDRTSSPVVADLDLDGELDIIICGRNGAYCLDLQGSLNWHNKEVGQVYSSPTIADINNNSYLEVVISAGNGKIFVLDYSGNTIINFRNNIGLDFRTYEYSSPLIVDLNKDGRFEIIIGSTNRKVTCLEFAGVLSSGIAPWNCFKGTIYRTSNLDSDGDFLDDITEVVYNTSIMDADSDSDQYTDGEEIFSQTDPLNSLDFPSWERLTPIIAKKPINWPLVISISLNVLLIVGFSAYYSVRVLKPRAIRKRFIAQSEKVDSKYNQQTMERLMKELSKKGEVDESSLMKKSRKLKVKKFKGKSDSQICMICKVSIKPDTNIVQCKYCRSLFHINHMNSWMLNYEICPVCKRNL
ncbi:MAG: PQQ-binding-like beta-propeller repeat protein [Asgard group archaeon]|nr:PQQ-binding-like beta-propeller repeat protein [Asgard group archaeon]